MVGTGIRYMEGFRTSSFPMVGICKSPEKELNSHLISKEILSSPFGRVAVGTSLNALTPNAHRDACFNPTL